MIFSPPNHSISWFDLPNSSFRMLYVKKIWKKTATFHDMPKLADDTVLFNNDWKRVEKMIERMRQNQPEINLLLKLYQV